LFILIDTPCAPLLFVGCVPFAARNIDYTFVYVGIPHTPICIDASQSELCQRSAIKKVLRAEQTFLIAPHCEGTKKRRFHPRQEIWTAKPICLIRSQGDVHWHSPCTPSPSVCVGRLGCRWGSSFLLRAAFFCLTSSPHLGRFAPPITSEPVWGF
jgi:hypothetical protein